MLVRLLFAVLTLAGPTPVRLCACDTAHHAESDSRHDADHESDDTAPCADHDCDCPVVSAPPAVPPASPDTAPDAVATAHALLDAPAPVRRAARPPGSDPPPRSLPLYLSLLTLRI